MNPSQCTVCVYCHAEDVIALDTGSFTMLMIQGANKDGTPFQTMLMEPMGGVVGARSWNRRRRRLRLARHRARGLRRRLRRRRQL